MDVEASIPKVVHYVWVGPQKFPFSAQKNIESWKKYLPDFEFKLWNETNAPMDHPYVATMYKKKKWAFVSDYIRFWALEKEGGIYLDTDMEALKSFEPLRAHQAFLGNTGDGYTACGIIGAVPHHPFIQRVIEFYNADTSHSIENTSPRIVTNILNESDFVDVMIYRPSYFYPCDDGEQCTAEMKKNAYTTHHWAETWVPFARVRKILRRMGIMSILKDVLGRKRV